MYQKKEKNIEADIFMYGSFNMYNEKVMNKRYKLEELCRNDSVEMLDEIFIKSKWIINTEY